MLFKPDHNDYLTDDDSDTPEFELGSISFDLDPSVKNNQEEDESSSDLESDLEAGQEEIYRTILAIILCCTRATHDPIIPPRSSALSPQ